MGAIIKKEFRSTICGVIGPLFIAAVLAIMGFFTYLYQFNGLSTHIEYAVISASFYSLIAVPVLTMRTFSEEKRLKTDQLLYSLPITSTKVVMGKYFALVAVFAIPCAVICAFPPILNTYAEGGMTFSVIYGSIGAYFLLGCAVIAICMFLSSLTESQVISAILSLGVVLLLYFMETISSSVGNVSEIAGKILSAICIFQPIYNFGSGIFDIPCLVYYLSIAALFCFFTVQSFEKKRWM